MAQIIPAILEDNIDKLNSKILAVLKIPEVQRIQIDFSDGKFTDRTTVMPDDIDLLNPAYVWEAHLMVQDPSKYFFDLKVAGFNNALIHYEAVSTEQFGKICDELQKLNLTCSLAINPETEIEKILPILSLFESITIMGVKPGYQGQELAPETFNRIKKLREASKNVIIEVDGGVKLSNISELVAVGADRLIAGSALFKAEPDDKGQTFGPTENYRHLMAKIS